MAIWITHTAEGLGLRQELAGAGSRMLAGAIDLLILVTAFLLAVLALFLISRVDPLGGGSFLWGLLIGGALLLLIAYGIVFELVWGGQTPGKRALALRVRNLDGGPPSTLQSILRGCFYPLDLFFAPMPIGLLLIAALPLSQRLGDLAAGTMVVRIPRAGGRAAIDPWPGQLWSKLEPRLLPLAPALSARYTRADLAHLRQLLARGEPATLTELETEARRRLYVSTAREYCARIGVERFGDARVVLKELYLFLREMQADDPAAQAQRTRRSGR